MVPWFGTGAVALGVALVGLLVVVVVGRAGSAGWAGPFGVAVAVDGRDLAPPRHRVAITIGIVMVGVVSVGWWAHRAKSGLVVSGASYDSVRAIVRSDPKPVLGGNAVELSIDGHRWQATIGLNQSTTALRVGDTLKVSGSTVPFVSSSAYRQSRHLAGRFRVRRIEAVSGGALPYRWANTIRSSLLRSAVDFPATERTLFAGFVLGDVRSARAELTDDFRASGLSHLVVVSGQNLAFLLAGVHPFVRLVGRRSRLASLAMQAFVVVSFVFVARFEPSVLRAAAMAAIALLTRAAGRPQPLRRIVLVTAALLLLVDPLLIRSVGFALSVGAVGGIAVFEPHLRARLQRFGVCGPPLAVTLAAQLGTAPCLLLVFDGVPVVSLFANLLALPLAAPIMGWGVVAGIPAGFLGPGVSAVVHVPTRLLLGAIAAVARWSANLPLGSVTAVDAAVIATAGVFVWGWSRLCLRRETARHSLEPIPAIRQISRRFLVIALLVPFGRHVITAPISTGVNRSGTFGPAVTWWGNDHHLLLRHIDVVVLTHGASASRLLEALRAQRIGSVDLVVVASGGKPQTGVVRALAHRVDVGLIVGAPGVGAVRGTRWQRAVPGTTWRAGSHLVSIVAVHERRVEIAVAHDDHRPP